MMRWPQMLRARSCGATYSICAHDLSLPRAESLFVKDSIGRSVNLEMRMKRICIFCGSSFGLNSEFAAAATALTEYLVAAKIGIVYGGSNRGLMGIVADTALARAVK